MSVSSVKIILDRISVASTSSPIAVFVVPNGGKYGLDAVFADTYETQRRTKTHSSGYIGSFTKFGNEREIELKLNDAQKGLR